jgi:hypothetical protein
MFNSPNDAFGPERVTGCKFSDSPKPELTIAGRAQIAVTGQTHSAEIGFGALPEKNRKKPENVPKQPQIRSRWPGPRALTDRLLP